jgi:ketosteroid isomerase-like protein
MNRLLVVCAVVLAGCGSTPSGDEAAIRDTISRYQAAVRANDAKTICTQLLGQEFRDAGKASGRSCEQVWGDQIVKGGPKYKIVVQSVRIQGDRALVKTRSIESDGRTRYDKQPLTRINGHWLLTK